METYAPVRGLNMATLKDIAKIANVNISTVSKALRNSSDLSEQTKQTIRAIADHLDYPYATEIEPGKSNVVGIIIPDIVSPYYNTTLQSLHLHLLESRYRVLVMYTFFNKDEEYACYKELLRNRVSAVICFSSSSVISPEFRDIILKNNIPFLLVGANDDCDFCDSVYIDHWKTVTIATNHLIELGHKRIAYLGEPFAEARRVAFVTALQAKHIDTPPEYIVDVNERFELCGYKGMKELLKLPERPTAVFAAYDGIAVGAMRAIQEVGLQIPKDISIVGVDDSHVGNYLNVRLTSVTEPTQDLGELVSDMILQKMAKQRKFMQTIRLQPTLKIRESTAPPAE